MPENSKCSIPRSYNPSVCGLIPNHTLPKNNRTELKKHSVFSMFHGKSDCDAAENTNGFPAFCFLPCRCRATFQGSMCLVAKDKHPWGRCKDSDLFSNMPGCGIAYLCIYIYIKHIEIYSHTYMYMYLHALGLWVYSWLSNFFWRCWDSQGIRSTRPFVSSSDATRGSKGFKEFRTLEFWNFAGKKLWTGTSRPNQFPKYQLPMNPVKKSKQFALKQIHSTCKV